MAQHKSAATPAAAGTATSAEPKAKAAAKVEATVHPKLLDLIRKQDAAAEKAASFLVEIGELVTRENISNPVLIRTIMEARGVTEVTAKSQASRLRALLKDTDSFEALKRGEVTVRAAVKSAQTRRQAATVTAAKAFDNALNKFVTAAKAVGQDRRTIVTTVEAALEKAGIK